MRKMIFQNADFSEHASHLEIKVNGSQASILVDGHELKGVRAFKLEHTANGLPIPVLDISALDVTFDTQFVKYQSIDGQELDIRYKHKKGTDESVP